ncbi:MAG: trehalose-phosphatase [Candidatus Eisenbacteria bacterium]|nr:trehalose-phosphatase [Candidatus Eisenbacteria bacterium]
MSATGSDRGGTAESRGEGRSDAPDRLVDVAGVPDFWDRVRRAPSRCLVLDYDGTLAPFHEDRMKARPLDGVVPLLEEIRDSDATDLAIMTGRPLSELLQLLGDLGVPVSASQGTEFRIPDGTDFRIEPRRDQTKRLDRAFREARDLGFAETVERKNASVALHTRPMTPDEARAAEDRVAALWERDASEHDLEVRRFLGGVELRVLGIDKGTALLELLGDVASDTLCVYIGDDETDEDALAVVRRLGVGIKVGSLDRPTHAGGRLGTPRDVRRFLRAWVEVTKGR